MTRRHLCLLLALLAAPAAAAEPPRLLLPIDCALGETCWIINYPDTDPGKEARDFACRPRSYDTHDGTDVAVRDVAALARGVAVRAAAAGKVLQVRDGEEEGLWMAGRSAEVLASKKECGNRVAIAHDGGWASDYCHLKKGSVAVKPGDVVAAGQPIGQVGLSGMTAFPHAHMALLRLAQPRPIPVDPFTGAELSAGCGKPAAALWSQPMAYQPASLYAAGFAEAIPSGEALKADASSPATLPRTAEALVLWGTVFGAAPGDRITARVTGPDGAVLFEQSRAVDKDQAWRSAGFGRKRGPEPWPAGPYSGTMTLDRAGMAPQIRTVTVELR